MVQPLDACDHPAATKCPPFGGSCELRQESNQLAYLGGMADEDEAPMVLFQGSFKVFELTILTISEQSLMLGTHKLAPSYFATSSFAVGGLLVYTMKSHIMSSVGGAMSILRRMMQEAQQVNDMSGHKCYRSILQDFRSRLANQNPQAATPEERGPVDLLSNQRGRWQNSCTILARRQQTTAT